MTHPATLSPGHPVSPPALIPFPLDHLDPADDPRIASISKAELIITLVARHFGLTRPQLMARRRTAELVWARQIAMYLVRDRCAGLSLAAIGDLFDGRDHGTVLFAVRAVRDRMKIYPGDRRQVETVTREISTGQRLN